MKKAILVAIIGAMTLGVNAGDWGKAPVGKAPIEECVDLGGVISVGWMSDYIFYGERLAESSVWADVNYTFDGLAVPITIGAWYLSGLDSTVPGFFLGDRYDELDLYAKAAIGTFAGFDATVGYTFFYFPGSNNGPPALGIAETHEFGIDLTRSLGIVDLALESNYNANLNAWYHQVGISKTFGITDNISLVLGTGVAYSDNYFAVTAPGALSNGRDTGWNHYYATASLPIQLNCRTTLTPYIGFNGATNGMIIDNSHGITGNLNPINGEDILHGGVSLSVTF